MRKNERQELPTTGDKGQAKAAASGETKQTSEARDQGIVRTSIIGIIGNLFLVVFKGAIGLAARLQDQVGQSEIIPPANCNERIFEGVD